MKQHSIAFKDSHIHYTVTGNGSQAVVAFHGYGEEANHFSILKNDLPTAICLVSITLPLHGNTEWKEQDGLTIKDIFTLIQLVLNKEQLNADQFSLVGYSLGGRICLKLLEQYPQYIQHTLLLAPDGIKMFFLQYLATQNIFSKHIFGYTIRHPQWFLVIIKLIKFLKIVHPSIAEFVIRLMSDKVERTTLYNRWMMFKYLHPNIIKVRENIVQYNKKVDIVIGQYDKLIKPSTIDGLKKGIDDSLIRIHKLPTGHILMKDKFAAQIASLL